MTVPVPPTHGLPRGCRRMSELALDIASDRARSDNAESGDELLPAVVPPGDDRVRVLVCGRVHWT